MLVNENQIKNFKTHARELSPISFTVSGVVASTTPRTALKVGNK
jgi:hypothetical protein